MAERQYCRDCGAEIMRSGRVDGSMVWLDVRNEARNSPNEEPFETSGRLHRHQPPSGTPMLPLGPS